MKQFDMRVAPKKLIGLILTFTLLIGLSSGNQRSLQENIPSGSWIVKIQNSYSVCPDFGKSLFGLLGINVSSFEPSPTPQT